VQLPSALLNSLNGIKGFDKEAFENVHSSGEQITSIRINPSKGSMVNGKWSIGAPVHYSLHTTQHSLDEFGYYLEQRPSFTFDPHFMPVLLCAGSKQYVFGTSIKTNC
jgi:hypothetical protein